MVTYDNVRVHVSESGGFEYICFEDVPLSYKNEFGNWLFGQTMSVGDMCNNGTAIYLFDFERFWELKFRNKPTHFD